MTVWMVRTNERVNVFRDGTLILCGHTDAISDAQIIALYPEVLLQKKLSLQDILFKGLESTCQKRIVICALFDKYGNLLSIGTNHCTPPDGGCVRLGTVSTKAGYSNAGCNSTHAEEEALNALQEGQQAHIAQIYGHDFACRPCEEKLRAHGVQDISIYPGGYGSGLRNRLCQSQ